MNSSSNEVQYTTNRARNTNNVSWIHLAENHGVEIMINLLSLDVWLSISIKWLFDTLYYRRN